MKLALFDDFQLGVVKEDRVYKIGETLFKDDPLTTSCQMVDFIHQYEQVKEKMESYLSEAASVPLSEVRFRHPVSKPGKIVAAPVNYLSHKKEMKQEHTARGMGFFLKANTSMIGPGDSVILPYEDREIHHELELAFVIGKQAKRVKAEDALDYVFGYTGLIDVTLRPDETHNEERCLRKSFDTFTPIGPWIATKDEIANPDNVNMELTVNGEIRQKVNTKELICNVAELIEIYSHVLTLEPGDIVATGTPDGVGPIKDGDVVRLSMEGIGEFSVDVKLADHLR